MRHCLEGAAVNQHTMINFSFSFQAWMRSQGFNFSKIHLHLPIIFGEQVTVKAGMFEKTRIRYLFNTLAIVIFKETYPILMNVSLPFWLYRKHLYDQRKKGWIWRLNQTGSFFFLILFFGFTHLLCFKKSDWRPSVNKPQKGNKEFYKSPRYAISYKVTSNLGTFGGRGRQGHLENCACLLKKSWLPPDKYCWYAEESIFGFDSRSFVVSSPTTVTSSND